MMAATKCRPKRLERRKAGGREVGCHLAAIGASWAPATLPVGSSHLVDIGPPRTSWNRSIARRVILPVEQRVNPIRQKIRRPDDVQDVVAVGMVELERFEFGNRSLPALE